MNHRQAYNGLAATYRHLRKKVARLTDDNSVLAAKNNVLSSADPQLAHYVDENYRLSTDNRTLGQEVADLKRAAQQAEESAALLRRTLKRRDDDLDAQKKATIYGAGAAVLFGCLFLVASGLLYWQTL